MKKQLSLFLTLLSSSLLFSNNDPIGGWYMYFGNVRFNESKWQLSYDLQYRNHEMLSDLNQFVTRASVQYRVLDQLTFAAGYAYIHTEQIDEPDTPFHEHRVFQDVLTQQKMEVLTLKHRFRLEERFIENQDFRSRIRYQLGIDVPIYKSKEHSRQIFATAYNEIFMKLDETRKTNVFDRNRLYLGAGYKFNKDLGVQFGWMNQMLQKKSNQQFMFSLHHNIGI